MFQRLLVPLDGPLRAEQAIPVAARLASASHSSIVLIRVIDVFLDCSWQMAGVPPDLTGALEVASKPPATTGPISESKSAAATVPIAPPVIPLVRS